MALALGFLAGLLTTAAFLPQAIRSWRTRSTADLSLAAILVFVAGISLWVAYGIVLRSPPLIFWNVVTLVINLGILGAKLRHG